MMYVNDEGKRAGIPSEDHPREDYDKEKKTRDKVMSQTTPALNLHHLVTQTRCK
jgi:hypothetical protein